METIPLEAAIGLINKHAESLEAVGSKGYKEHALQVRQLVPIFMHWQDHVEPTGDLPAEGVNPEDAPSAPTEWEKGNGPLKGRRVRTKATANDSGTMIAPGFEAAVWWH